MITCPNKNLKEWQELEATVPDMAYTIWDLNNGNGIESSPNGEHSILFGSLLDYYNGDRTKAIRAKAKFYSNNFISKVGNWITDTENTVEKDVNGEPLFQSYGQYVVEDSHQVNRSEITPIEALFSPSEPLSSGQVITTLGEKVSDLQSLIMGLFKVFTDTNVPVVIEENTNEYMWFDAGTGTIHISKQAWNVRSINQNAVAFMHEMVHAYTSVTLHNVENGTATRQEQSLYNSIKKLYEEYKGMFPDSEDFYGFTDLHEFVAELLTNQTFLDTLLDYAQQRNILQKIAKFVQEVFNKIVEFFTGLPRTNNIENLQEKIYDLISYNVDNNVTTVNDWYNNNTQDLIHRMDRYDFGNRFSKEKLADLKQKLLISLESQAQAAKSVYDPELRRTTEAIITYNKIQLQNSAKDDVEVIFNFMRDIIPILEKIKDQIIWAYQGKTGMLSDDQLQTLSKTFIGFYKNYSDMLEETVFRMGDYEHLIDKEAYEDFKKQFEYIQQMINYCSTAILRMQVQNAQKTIVAEGLKVENPTIYQYIVENTVSTTSDISVLTRWLGAGDKMNDEAIKTVFSILQGVENKVRFRVFNAATTIMNLRSKLSSKDLQALYEVDENGKPTAYFVRDRKYGKFLNDYHSFLSQLREKYGMDYQDMLLPENAEIRRKFNAERNKWLAKHCERRYTEEYYKLFEGLSEETQIARQQIVQRILDIQDRFRTADGYVDYDALRKSTKIYNDYVNLQLEKRLLASPYDANGMEKPIGSVDRMIADELWNLNQQLNEGIKYTVNRERFNKVLQEKKRTLSKEEFESWTRNNMRYRMKEAFQKKLRDLQKKEYGSITLPNGTVLDYDVISENRRRLINPYRDPFTGDIDADRMPIEVRRKINRFDIQLSKIRKAYNKKHGINPEDNTIFKYAHYEETDAYKRARKRAYERYSEDPDLMEQWLDENTFIGADGKRHPKSYWTKLVANNPDDMEYVPSSEFNELSDESVFANKNFDRSNPEYYQPKKDLYDNSTAYNRIQNNPELKALYDALLHLMEVSNNAMDDLKGLSKYRMPQITGSMYRFLKHSDFTFKGLTQSVAKKLKDATSVRNDDVGIDDKVKYAPDGSALTMVPRYFIKELEDPSTISADICGIVLMYYRMSQDFLEKTKVRGKLENIKVMVGQRVYKGKGAGFKGFLDSVLHGRNTIDTGSNVAGVDTNTYKFINEFLNMNLYGVNTKRFTITVKNREVDLTKIMLALKTVGTTINLGLNFICAFTGFFTALHSGLVEAVSGRYYDFNDAMYGFKDLICDLLRHGISAGRRSYKSQQMAYMDYFEVGSTTDSIFNNSNRPQFINFITRHWAFGSYSMFDYLIKGTVLNSVMYNYRLINGEFINKEQYLAKYGDNDQTRDKWRAATTFKGATQIAAGKLQALDSKNQAAVDKVKAIIGDTARSLAAQADGQLTSLQKAQFQSNVIGALCMMHRNYIPGIIQNKWTMTRQWDYTTHRWNEAMVLTPLRVLLQMKKDEQNTNILLSYLKEISISPWQSSSKQDSLTRSNLKKLQLELGLTLILYNLVAAYLKAEADKDKDNFWLNFIAFVVMRTQFESFTPYNLVDLYRTLKQPTALFSTIDSFGSLIYSPITALWDVIDPFAKPKSKYIEKGSYEGFTRFQKAVIKATPFKNLLELNDIPSKRRYYEQQVMGNR